MSTQVSISSSVEEQYSSPSDDLMGKGKLLMNLKGGSFISKRENVPNAISAPPPSFSQPSSDEVSVFLKDSVLLIVEIMGDQLKYNSGH